MYEYELNKNETNKIVIAFCIRGESNMLFNRNYPVLCVFVKSVYLLTFMLAL